MKLFKNMWSNIHWVFFGFILGSLIQGDGFMEGFLRLWGIAGLSLILYLYIKLIKDLDDL